MGKSFQKASRNTPALKVLAQDKELAGRSHSYCCIGLLSLHILAIAAVVQYRQSQAGTSSTIAAVQPASGPPCGFHVTRVTVPVSTIARHDRFADAVVARAEPVVLRGSSVTRWKAQRWSLSYIGKKMAGRLHNIYENNNRWFGPYFDERKPLVAYSRRPNPYRTNLTLPVHEFLSRLEPNRSSAGTVAGEANTWIYYSGPAEELGGWALDDIEPLDELLSPNPAVSSVNVWMGPPNVVAHCHYDGYHNFYAQLVGRKRFWLVRPRGWPRLSVSPFLHPMHAQCQVNLSVEAATDAAGAACGVGDSVEVREVVLGPGDLLYIPPLWFHHVESIDTSVSVNVWTDSTQSAVALDVFERPIPGSKLLANRGAQQRALLATAVAYSMLSVVCGSGSCSMAGDQAPLSSKLAAHHFLSTLFTARYQPMLDSGLLRQLPEPEWTRPLCSSGDVALQVQDELGDAYEKFSDELRAFAASVASSIRRLPDETMTIWLGNYVEFLGAQYVQPEHVAHWLEDSIGCL